MIQAGESWKSRKAAERQSDFARIRKRQSPSVFGRHNVYRFDSICSLRTVDHILHGFSSCPFAQKSYPGRTCLADCWPFAVRDASRRTTA